MLNKSPLYELLPIRLTDLEKLITWLWSTQIAVVQLILLLTVFIIRLLLKVTFKTWTKVIILLLAAWIFKEIGTLFLCIIGFAAIWFNLDDQRKDGLSAYSVFNKNFQAIMGQLTGEQLNRQFRHEVVHEQ